MSTSTAQIEANRANAQKSTGPKSNAGKAASSRNATSHGLTSKEVFVRPGEETDYLALEEELTALYDPRNAAEGIFFKILIHSAWNLRRCRQLEAILQTEANQKGLADPLLDSDLAPKVERIARHLRAAERSHSKALAELRKLQTEDSYRATCNEANHVDSSGISVAVELQKVEAQFNKDAKSKVATAGMKLRNRYAPGMPAFSDNGDGTLTAWTASGRSIVRITDSLILDVVEDGKSPAVSTKAAAA